MMTNKTRSGVIKNTPCDGCGKESYDFYTTESGMSRQIEVLQFGAKMLCQRCRMDDLITDEQGYRQVNMFGDGE